jgi:nucleoid DNA-binding protein
VIQLQKHIEILLLSNDCVIVPGFGGFVTHHVDARYDESDGMFLPPLRTLGFNPQLRLNDHLLVQSYIEAYDISYPEALRRIEDEVSELKQHLETGAQYELNGLGSMRLNEEGHYEFEPCEAGILTPDYYGLSTFEMLSLSMLKKREATTVELPAARNKEIVGKKTEDRQAENASNEEEDAFVIRMSWLRNIAAVAAAVLAFFLIGTPISNSDIRVEHSSVVPTVVGIDTDMHKEEAAPVTENLDATAEKTNAETAVKVLDKVQKQNYYTIVLASQTPAHNAADFLKRLENVGLVDAYTMKMNTSDKVRVVYGKYYSQEEAKREVQSLRKLSRELAEAWVMEIK